jgi:hypothetical protein
MADAAAAAAAGGDGGGTRFSLSCTGTAEVSTVDTLGDRCVRVTAGASTCESTAVAVKIAAPRPAIKDEEISMASRNLEHTVVVYM